MRSRAVLAATLAAAFMCPVCVAEAGASTGRPPVVVLILDELPTDALLRPDGTIDAERYPGFADLAAHSTWFPNASTVYDSTYKAVPAILDAVLPSPRTAPDRRSHPRSVYDLFHRLGYRVIDVETSEALCPPRICPGARNRRPGVLRALAGGGRPALLRKWIGAIRERRRPTFYLQHTLLPHAPWIYLPSGYQTRPAGRDPVHGIDGAPGFHDRGLTAHNEVRHLLQVGYVDRQVGQLLARLRRTGLFDEALLVVTADHGIVFKAGVPSRRRVTTRNVEHIAPVPLFVKAPGQTDGEVSESLVRNMDIVPTVADLLDVRLGWRHDGRSAFATVTRRRERVSLVTRDFRRVIRIGRDQLARRRLANRLRRARLVSTGRDSSILYGSPWAALYRVGSHPELIGRSIEGLPAAPAGAVRANVANAHLLETVDFEGKILPTRVTGSLDGGPDGSLRDVAVTVEGRVWATGRSFRLHGTPGEHFSLLVPEESLRPGPNRVALFEVLPDGRLAPL